MKAKRPYTRSEQMSRIRGTDTEPELIVRRRLWAEGVRYRLHYRTPGGRADLAVPAAKFALFVDGCFWHGCPEHYVRPRSKQEFWDAKLRENVDRDCRQTLALDDCGWSVLRVWEHEVGESPEHLVREILRFVGSTRRTRKTQWRVARVEFLDPTGDLERRHLEDLRSGSERRVEEGRRSTRKLGRVVRRHRSHSNESPP